MREIKFRAWDKDASLMRVVSDIGWMKDGSGLSGAVLTKETGHDQFLPIDKVILMQFTGLHDKNGKEIYEGDVVAFVEPGMKNCQAYGEVSWQKDGWAVDGFWNGNQDEPGRPFSENAPFEVIGDIYSNPELLKS
jgi:uncharacterized phage protein (TIGR01671 family)